MEALNSSMSSLSVPYSTASSTPPKSSKLSSSSHSMTESPLLPNSLMRQWRPAAKRNLKNQWSKLASHRQKWSSLSSTGRSVATELVNSYLSQRYMDTMDLGVLKDMHKIKEKACLKLFKKQLQHRSRLLSSYKDMVAVVINMVNTSNSQRCFQSSSRGSPILKFSCSSEDKNDAGDAGGIPVFTFWSISNFETLAQEFVDMFKGELALKRLLVVELLSLSCDVLDQVGQISWSDELYPGETDDLRTCKMLSEETCEPVLPRVESWRLVTGSFHFKAQPGPPDHEALQIYLTTWLAEVNIDSHRVDEIFDAVEEEIHSNNLGFVSAHK